MRLTGDPPEEKLCDYCHLPCPEETVTHEDDDYTYEFCCDACMEAMRDSDRVFTQYHNYRWFRTGVSAIDESLPQGLPRNSFVLIAGDAGTRKMALQAELVWRTLQRGEPAVILALKETPLAIVQQFLTLDWNVLPYLDAKQLHIIDAFTHRMDNRERIHDEMNKWNRHVQSVVNQSTTTVTDPKNTSGLGSTIDRVLREMSMIDEGLLIIDSLTELGTLVQSIKARTFVKQIRAEVCKSRFVPVFAGSTYMTVDEAFPRSLEYMADGIIDLKYDDSLVDGVLLRRIRLRKMNEVLSYPEWNTYEYTSQEGLVQFDPIAQLEEAAEAGEVEVSVEEIDSEQDANDGDR